MSPRRPHRGYSLVELLVVIAVFSTFVASVFHFRIQFAVALAGARGAFTLEEEAGRVHDFLASDIRAARRKLPAPAIPAPDPPSDTSAAAADPFAPPASASTPALEQLVLEIEDRDGGEPGLVLYRVVPARGLERRVLHPRDPGREPEVLLIAPHAIFASFEATSAPPPEESLVLHFSVTLRGEEWPERRERVVSGRFSPRAAAREGAP